MDADIKIIAQLSAAENILHVFPSPRKIGDFSTRALKKVPGIARNCICFKDLSQPSGDLVKVSCEDCHMTLYVESSKNRPVCRFDGRQNPKTYYLQTPAHFFGFLIIEIEDPALFSPYAPFINNFSNTISINMENLWQKEQLQTKNRVLKQHRQNLESLIEKRTRQLAKTQKEQIFLEKQLHHARKAESLGRMAGAIAHHFNNQLNVIMGNLEMALEDSPADAVYHENLTAAMHAAGKSAEISGLMLTYLGQGEGETGKLELSRFCLSYLPMLRPTLPGGIVLETDFMSVGPVVLANANNMQMILSHLITNAAEAIGDKTGRIKLATKILSVSDIPKVVTAPFDWQPGAKMYACMEVSDTGCGIRNQDMEKLFDPFFTTKFTGRGLGLSVVLGWVKSWDGALCVESKKDCGTRVRILLPVQENMVSPPSAAVSLWPSETKGGTVLLVDDQEAVRKIGMGMLQRLGFSPMSATSGPEAVDMFRRHQDQICCVITDLTMPDMDGWETLMALRKIKPDLPVILASGHDQTRAMNRDHPEKFQVFLHKPYALVQLKNALHKALQDKA